MGEMQKKNWIGWSGTEADEIAIGWKNVIMALKPGKYAYPANATPQLLGYEYGRVPGFNISTWITYIMGIEYKDNTELQNALESGSTALRRYLTNMTGYSIDLDKMESVVFFTKDKVYFYNTKGELREDNVEKLRKVFNSDIAFKVTIDLADLPSNVKEAVQSVGQSSSDRFTIQKAYTYVGGRLGSTWGGAVIVKK
ncbi:hypothetical protein [Mangrovibacterium marinum]|nr:hypothetical protein [Mangrovibacterium marinum]